MNFYKTQKVLFIAFVTPIWTLRSSAIVITIELVRDLQAAGSIFPPSSGMS